MILTWVLGIGLLVVIILAILYKLGEEVPEEKALGRVRKVLEKVVQRCCS